MKPRILLVGKTGQIGSELVRYLPRLGELVALGRAELDLSKPEAIVTAIEEVRPNLIVNAAAYTDVNEAEKDSRTATTVNADAPAVMVEEARKLGAALVHYSTDYVFDGSKGSPYEETDIPNPLNAYGRSKLAGERAIQASGVKHLILRTSWIYATRGTNFLLKFLRRSTEQAEVPVVHDQVGAPTWSRMIAAGTVAILKRAWISNAAMDLPPDFGGLFHLTAGGQASWHDFACAILEECRNQTGFGEWLREATAGRPLLARAVRPISSNEFLSVARRPAYSVLSNVRMKNKFGAHLPHWRQQLHMAISD